MVRPQVEHDDQAAIIYGSGRAGSLFSAAKTEETLDSGNVNDDEQGSVTTHVAEPRLPPPPRVSTPEQQVILVHETERDAWDFMALTDTSFSPDESNQKLLRKWLLHLHNDILDSVKALNDRRLPLRYPGPSDPVKEARDSLIHVEKLLSTGIIYRLPSRGKAGQTLKFTDRCNFMYHLLWREPRLLEEILYSAYMLSRGMTEYRASTPEGKPVYKTEGTLRTIVNLAEKVTRVRKKIDLEREQQLLVLCQSLVDSANDHGLVLRPASACAIRCSLEQAKIVGAFKTDHMFGFLDSYHLRMAKSPDPSSDKVFDINQHLQADVEVHVGVDVKLTPQ